MAAITKCGNGHARLFLIEAAHHYRLPPKISKELSRRQEGQSKRVRQIAWIAQNRLHRRTWKLITAESSRNSLAGRGGCGGRAEEGFLGWVGDERKSWQKKKGSFTFMPVQNRLRQPP